MPARAIRPVPQGIRPSGGCTFAEDPNVPAPLARVILHAGLDPGTLPVSALATTRGDPDSIALADLAAWLTLATDIQGREHAVLSDGRHHIRLDIEEGSLSGQTSVRFRYRLEGIASAEVKLLPLRRFLDFCRHRRFSKALFPGDARVARGLEALRVHDALMHNATYREIAEVLWGEAQVDRQWSGRSDSLRSRLRRLAQEARAMGAGGYRHLLRRR